MPKTRMLKFRVTKKEYERLLQDMEHAILRRQADYIRQVLFKKNPVYIEQKLTSIEAQLKEIKEVLNNAVY